MVESVWQEYNINRTGNKYVYFSLLLKISIASLKMPPCLTYKMSVSTRRKFTTLTNGTCEEESDKTGLWDFVESTHRPVCNCSRYVEWNAFSNVFCLYLKCLVMLICVVLCWFFFHIDIRIRNSDPAAPQDTRLHRASLPNQRPSTSWVRSWRRGRSSRRDRRRPFTTATL